MKTARFLVAFVGVAFQSLEHGLDGDDEGAGILIQDAITHRLIVVA